MSRLPFLALVALFFCFVGGAAFANCLQYGATATAQQNENVALGCGFSGLRWHGDTAGHAAFCALVGEGKVSGETAIREAELAKCRPAAPAGAADAAGDANTPAGQCQRTEVAEGTGTSKQEAQNAAHDQLGRQRAEMINSGLTQCMYHDLGCAGSGSERTCWMSVECCAK